MRVPLGVRKGAWTEEEDVLLKKCIEDYGVGKWNLVPFRAGLNRCRKSCRLRWLNYLRPNIKREPFASDEADLIIRLRKLLGNRWSLIAGRLPGRTANNVKNYWNTHLQKKMIGHQLEEMKISKAQKTVKTKAIKPQPRIFPRNLSWLKGPLSSTIVDDSINLSTSASTSTSMQLDNGISWWERLLLDKEEGENIHLLLEEPIVSQRDEDNNIAPPTKAGDTFLEQDQSGWNEFSVSMDLWNILNAE